MLKLFNFYIFGSSVSALFFMFKYLKYEKKIKESEISNLSLILIFAIETIFSWLSILAEIFKFIKNLIFRKKRKVIEKEMMETLEEIDEIISKYFNNF